MYSPARIFFSLSIACLLVVAVLRHDSSAGPDTKERLRLKLAKPLTIEQQWVRYNRWGYVMRNDGSYFFNAAQGDFGGEFPRGSGFSGVFAAGIWIGGLKAGVEGAEDTINVSQVEFESEFQPGKILVGGVADRGTYRGNMNYSPSNTRTALRGDLRYDDLNKPEYEVYVIDERRYGDDYKNWPSYAPKKSDGSPALIGVAQTYAVFHDLNTSLTNLPQFSNSPGFGLEVELETFVLPMHPNSIFLKLMITNKSTSNYKDAYLGIWSDVDIGSQAFEDLAVSDSVLGLAYIYSAPSEGDTHYTGLGIGVLQGPVVTAGEVGDSLAQVFADRRTILSLDRASGVYVPSTLNAGEFHIGLSSVTSYPSAPGGNCGQSTGDICRYNFLRGLLVEGNPKPGGPWHPWITSPADARVLLSTGPFTMESGETEEIWYVFSGGEGSMHGFGNGTALNPDSGTTVWGARNSYLLARAAYENAFAMPQAPPAPKVVASGQDGRVVLRWDNSAEVAEDDFGERMGFLRSRGYSNDYRTRDFQGYRVYRSLTGLEGTLELKAEYDLQDGIVEVVDTTYTPYGLSVEVIHVGSDSMFSHVYVDSQVTNGRSYYYSVTSFDYQPQIFLNGIPMNIPRTMESSRYGVDHYKQVTPMSPTIDAPLGAVAGVVQSAGVNLAGYDGHKVEAVVLEASLLTGRTYRLEFFRIPDSVGTKDLVGVMAGTLAYAFKDSATGSVVGISNYVDDPGTFLDADGDGIYNPANGDEPYDDGLLAMAIETWDGAGHIVAHRVEAWPVVDGVEYHLYQPQEGIAEVVEMSEGSTVLAEPRGVLLSWNETGRWRVEAYSGESSNDVYLTDRILSLDQLGLARASSPLLKGYPGVSDYELRFTSQGGVGWTRNSSGATGVTNANLRLAIPFELWDVGVEGTGANDEGDDKPLTVKIAERTPASNRNLTSFVYDTIYTSQNTEVLEHFGYTNLLFGTRVPTYDTTRESTGECEATDVTFGYLAFRASIPQTHSDTLAFIGNPHARMPAVGTVVRVVTRKLFQPGCVYHVRTEAPPSLPRKTLKKALKHVRAVPNPYYGSGTVTAYGTVLNKKVAFTGLPRRATIRIFTLAGDLVRTLRHDEGSNNAGVVSNPGDSTAVSEEAFTSIEVWDLRNRKGRYVASGLYVVHIDAPGIGTTTLKLAILMDPLRSVR